MFKKIDLFVDGKYYTSTKFFKTLTKAKESLQNAHWNAGRGWSDGISADRIKAEFAKA